MTTLMSETLRLLLRSEDTLVMPDAYDPISARIIERAGFKAVQCSGGSIAIAACHIWEADLTLAENLEVTRKIVNAVSVPVMADGEDGYGDAETVNATVRGFIEAGAAGMNIEDLIPSRNRECRVVDSALMIDKITAARDAAASKGCPGFIINARTDALRACETRADGMKEAIRRANLYLGTGADLAFICYTDTLDEVKTLVSEIRGPISITAGNAYNMKAFTIADLRECGVARVSLPMLAIFSAIRAVNRAVSLISHPDGFSRIANEELYCSAEELTRLILR